MASSIPLQLFPCPPATALPPPRKSSLKHAGQTTSAAELKGLALQVTTRYDTPPTVQPASDHIKHSLFCDPSVSASPSRNPPTRQAHTRRRSSRNSLLLGGASSSRYSSNDDSSPMVEEDELAPLPVNKRFGSNSPPQRNPSKQLKRPAIPHNISTEAQPDTDIPLKDDDRLSPLPDKTRFTPPSPRKPEYPALFPTFSGSPSSAGSNSVSKSRRPQVPPAYAAPNHSMFPMYDHSRPLNEQQYYPTTTPAQPFPSEKVSKICSPVEKPSLKRYDSGVALAEGYETVPAADGDDLLAIWNASKGQFPVIGRKVQLKLHQPKGQCASLAIGASGEQPLYSMEKALAQSSMRDEVRTKHLAVERHCPTDGTSAPVIQLALPVGPRGDPKSDTDDVTDIFPQQAAIRAIEAAANSPAATAIATFDPTAASPEAARLAQDAVSDARRTHGCELVRSTRKRDSLGVVVASYKLEHPSLGVFPVTVAKTTKGASREVKARLCLHHPTATSAAIAAESLVLASLDFARDSCVLDVPGLLALESPYIIDTAVSALLAVAAMENAAVMTETLTFAPPPKTPIKERSAGIMKSKGRVEKSKPSASNRKWYKRTSKAIDKAEKALIGEPADVPAVTQGAIALLGLSLKGAVFLLEAGVKVTARVVVGVGHLASKP